MLPFCVKTIVKESHNFKLARHKKKKKKKKKEKKENILILAIWQLSVPQGMLFITKILEDEWYIVIKAYKCLRF